VTDTATRNQQITTIVDELTVTHPGAVPSVLSLANDARSAGVTLPEIMSVAHRIDNRNRRMVHRDDTELAAFDALQHINTVITADTRWATDPDIQTQTRTEWSQSVDIPTPDGTETRIVFCVQDSFLICFLPELVGAFWIGGPVPRNLLNASTPILLGIPVSATYNALQQFAKQGVTPYILGELTPDHTPAVLDTVAGLAADLDTYNPVGYAHLLDTATALHTTP
jgi:hypothetical protein